ncbi:MAG TPA: VIT family protein [Actinomycetales bacterium]|nr:VIT family protein [Actinomycetales bacterium]
MGVPTDQPTEHRHLEHDGSLGARLNWLRAGVLGANDGIVSVAGIVVGVAGATSDRGTILTAGVAGLVAGALSMAAGEYVSVSTQRDTEKALLAKEARELVEMPEEELKELVQIYRDKGLSERLAHEVAVELTERDAFAAHVDAELGLDPDDLTNPWHAALASAVAFTLGALLPLLAVVLPGDSWRVPVTFVAVVLALVVTGLLSASAGDASRRRAVWRNVIGGTLAMAVTYGVGQAVGGLAL